MRGKNENEKAVELLEFLDRATLEVLFEKLSINEAVNENGIYFLQGKVAFVERFGSQKGHQDAIGEATEASVDQKDLQASVERLDTL